jgi:hypothetical protein
MSELERIIQAESDSETETTAATTGERIRAMVDAEEAAIEAETPEEPDEDEGEEVTPDRIDPLTAALGRYIGEVMQILGPEVPIQPCPYCMGKGFDAMVLENDPHSDICPECRGYGKVATGSFVQGNEVRGCSHCNGAGYKTHSPTMVAPAEPQAATPIQVLTPEQVDAIAADARARVGQLSA